MLRKWNATDIHPQRARHHVDRQCQHGDDREDEQAPVVALVDFRGEISSCRSLMRSCRLAMSRSTTENSSLD
jgi:hypothetical protein